MKTPQYIKGLVQPTAQKPQGKKAWSVDLETVWLPFFTATNVQGDTAIPKEALGSPLRVAREKDGTPRFSSSGRPVIRIAPEINQQIKFVRENMVFNMMNFAAGVAKDKPQEFQAEVESCREAGAPITDKDQLDVRLAQIEMAKKARLAEEMAQVAGDAVEQSEQNRELAGASV